MRSGERGRALAARACRPDVLAMAARLRCSRRWRRARLRRGASFLVVVLAALGCGDRREPVAAAAGAGGESSAPEDGFGPVEGVDEGGRARRVGDAFYTAGQALLAPSDGTLWLFFRSYADPDFSETRVHLDHFDARGVKVGSSELASVNPDGLALHSDGSLGAVRNRCGPMGHSTCLYREDREGDVRETVWTAAARSIPEHRVDANGDVVATSEATFGDLNVAGVAGDGSGLHALAWHGSHVLCHFDRDDELLGMTDVLPRVVPPELPFDAPFDELLANAELAHQLTTDPVVAEEGVVIAATVTRGTLAALSALHGVELPLPLDPRCPDVVVALVVEPGAPPRYFSVPTPGCERLPKLGVVDGHAVVASVLRVDKEPEPNDTHQYDLALGIVDLATGAVSSHVIALSEDDIVHAVAPCGDQTVCLAGTTGARSVDTGSTVTMGDGFVLPVTLAGEVGDVWRLVSARHSEIQKLVWSGTTLAFFATVNGAITHTADADPWLGFNEGLLGTIEWPLAAPR